MEVDGNFNGFENNDKPDKWIVEIKPDMSLYKDPASDSFETTFSNSPCYSILFEAILSKFLSF